MTERAAYTTVEIDLSSTFSKKLLDGSGYDNAEISAVYLTPRDSTHSICPSGSMFSVHFGDGLPIMLTEVTPGYDFECGMLGGVRITNEIALPGQFVRLLVVFAGPKSAGGN